MDKSVGAEAVGIDKCYKFISGIIALKLMIVDLEQGVPLIGLSH